MSRSDKRQLSMALNDSAWTHETLGDLIFSIDAGVSVNSEDRPHGAGEVGVLKTSAISDGRFYPLQNKAVIPNERKRVVEPVTGGSILISRMNTPSLVGESCLVVDDWPNLFLPDRVWQLRVKSSKVDVGWLAHKLQSWPSRIFVQVNATGTSGSMKNLSKANLLSMKISCPRLPEQQKIRQILDSLNSQISTTAALLSKLELFHTGLLIDSFGVGGNIESVRQVPLGDLVSKDRPIVYGILMPGDDHPDGVPVIKVKDMKSGSINRDGLLRTSPAIDREYRRSRLRANDILLSIRGTVGRVCTVPYELENANITQDSARISVPKNLSTYVAHYLTSPAAQRFMDSETVGLAVRGINLRDVRRIEIPIVSDERAKAVVDALNASRSVIASEALGLTKLTKLRRGLMADLLNGGTHVSLETAS